MLIPCIFFHFIWWSVCIRHNYFVEFIKRYRLSIITIFGATSGGITSIGGGVIAFPVMTLGFTIPPPIARDFCIMCQAVGEPFKFAFSATLTFTTIFSLTIPLKFTLKFTANLQQLLFPFPLHSHSLSLSHFHSNTQH